MFVSPIESICCTFERICPFRFSIAPGKPHPTLCTLPRRGNLKKKRKKNSILTRSACYLSHVVLHSAASCENYMKRFTACRGISKQTLTRFPYLLVHQDSECSFWPFARARVHQSSSLHERLELVVRGPISREVSETCYELETTIAFHRGGPSV